MASQPKGRPDKIAAPRPELLRELLALTQRALLLVDLDGLEPLLERKEALIAALRALDEGAAEDKPPAGGAGQDGEQARLLQAILENERALEARMDEERKRVRQELRDLERQSRLRRYLQRGARRPKVDLKR